MDDSRLSTVNALLEKARSTPYPNEHEALAVKAYGMLAGYLNSLEPQGESEPRRRERRLLNDRRARRADDRAPTIDLTDAHAEAQVTEADPQVTEADPQVAAAEEPAGTRTQAPPAHHGATAAYRGFCDNRVPVGVRVDIAI